MSFDDLLKTDDKEIVSAGIIPKKTKKTEVSKTTKTIENNMLTKEIITEVMKGGNTIDEEVDRLFWDFPKLAPYPYEHFIPAFIMFYGEKGASKTTCAMSVPGNIFALTFEKRGNLTRPWDKIFGKDPRIQCFGVSEYIERGSIGKYRDTSNTVYAKIIQLMIRASRNKEKFDWVILDGLQQGQKISTLRMKALNNIGAFDKLPTKLLERWGERTLYLENIVIDLATSIARKGIILTSQNVETRPMFVTDAQEKDGIKSVEELPLKNPKWMDKIKEDVDTVVFSEIVKTPLSGGRNRLKWKSTINSNKLGGIGEFDITLQTDPKATIKLVEFILTSEMGFPVISYE